MLSIYIYIHIYECICIYVQRERERERERGEREGNSHIVIILRPLMPMEAKFSVHAGPCWVGQAPDLWDGLSMSQYPQSLSTVTDGDGNQNNSSIF